MNRTKLICIALVIVFTGLRAVAAPFLAISENSEVFLTGAVGVRADSNIFLTSTAVSDTILNFDYGAELKFGAQSSAKGVFSISDSISMFSSHSRLNSNLANARFSSNYDDGKTKVGLKAGYVETDDNQTDTLNKLDFRSRRNIFSVGGTVEIGATEKTSFGGGVDYSRTSYKRSGFADSNVVEVPLNYYYVITPKVDLSLGYRFRETQVSLGQDSKDSFYNIGARGQFTPKLNGQFGVGLNQRNIDGGRSESQLGITSSFNYAYSEKTNMVFGVSNDFGTTGQGKQQKSLSFNLNGQTNLNEQWSVSPGISYRSIDYYTRVDHYFEGSLGVTYVFNSNARFSATYSHRNNTTNDPLKLSEFTGDIFSLSANFRY